MTPNDGPTGAATISGGLMTWAAAVAGLLAGCTCPWQDLDTLHVEPPPGEAPPTSILWSSRDGSYLVQVRLDGDACVAAHQVPGTALEQTMPWSPDNGRVAASARRGQGPGTGGVAAWNEQGVVDGIETGPIVFVRPARDA
ncbi:MAG TPA: hypothetical protein VHZ03_30685 [Trebonia sp.]|nr:hypothetical protein [Trebonia sp.]